MLGGLPPLFSAYHAPHSTIPSVTIGSTMRAAALIRVQKQTKNS
jgi:hypothetical protein